MRSLLKLGLPIGVTYFAESSAFSLIALLVARFGSTQVAAHHGIQAVDVFGAVFFAPFHADDMARLRRIRTAHGIKGTGAS